MWATPSVDRSGRQLVIRQVSCAVLALISSGTKCLDRKSRQDSFLDYDWLREDGG